MEKAKITPGNEYGYREKRAAGSPLQHIRVLQHIRHNKWKAEWVEPNPGLTDYVESSQILVPWKDRKAFLRDEENAEQILSHSRDVGYQSDSPIVDAVQQVLESTGEEHNFSQGVLSILPEPFERIRSRARITDSAEPAYAYRDRFGVVHWPFDACIELAQKFCAVEPSAVLVGVESTEREWSSKATRRGEDYLIPLLNRYRASWALIRQWTGHDPAIAEREAHVERLERLVWDAIYALQKAGIDKEAARLRTALEKC